MVEVREQLLLFWISHAKCLQSAIDLNPFLESITVRINKKIMQTDPSHMMELLYEPKPGSKKAQVDLVFVHGPLGNHMSTWTHPETKTMWPRDLLPKDFPEARILAFKYSSTIEVFFPRTLEDYGMVDNLSNKLIDAIHSFRCEPETSQRPLILVGHSLGGLVCGYALLQTENKNLEDIFNSIRGLLFFGTPFMDEEDDRWGELAANLSKLAAPPDNHTITTYRKSDWKSPSPIVVLFKKLIEQRHFSESVGVVYFCEALPVDCESVKGFIVDEDAAVPSVDRNKVDIRATVIEADHISLCKYTDGDSEGYEKVREELQLIMSNFPSMSDSQHRFKPRTWEIHRKYVRFWGLRRF